MIRAVEVKAGKNYTLDVTYQDEQRFTLDMKPLLTGVFAALKDPKVFAKVKLAWGGSALEWPGGLDIDAYALRMPISEFDGEPGHRILAVEPAKADPISQAVEQMIKETGISKRVLSRRTGIKEQNLSRLTNRAYHGHSVASLRRVAAAFGREVEVRFVTKAKAGLVGAKLGVKDGTRTAKASRPEDPQLSSKKVAKKAKINKPASTKRTESKTSKG